MVVNQYQKIFLPVSKFYNREDEVDESKMDKMLITTTFTLSTDKVDILNTPNKENTPFPVVEIVDVKPEPTDHNINSNQVETGYYQPIQVIIDDNINTKELMKIDSIKLKEKEQFLSWYIDLTSQCAFHGICILQIDCMEKDITMGKDLSMKHMGMEKFYLHNHMPALVSKLLRQMT
eukprot:9540484-Ditylum_brightwellii.AAC.1